MKILVTGANGFIGKNLCLYLKNIYPDAQIFQYDVNSTGEELKDYCTRAEFVFHLAGVNRPQNSEDYKLNYEFLNKVLALLSECKNPSPVMFASSVQAELNNPYGKSKKTAEDILINFSRKYGNKILIYRFPNIFGKWCKPNYNSAVATFCYNIANGLPVSVSDRETRLNLVYIDDVLKELSFALKGEENRIDEHFCEVKEVYNKSLGQVTDLLYSFKESRESISLPDNSDGFEKRLYATYLTYLNKNDFCHTLKMNSDYRGSFTEMFRTEDRGQFSLNVIKPGVTKGNHFHNTKTEKYIVLHGKAVIRLRKPEDEKPVEYFTDGSQIKVVDIPAGYTHNIQNIGEDDLLTLMWCNECFDPGNPDTFCLEV